MFLPVDRALNPSRQRWLIASWHPCFHCTTYLGTVVIIVIQWIHSLGRPLIASPPPPPPRPAACTAPSSKKTSQQEGSFLLSTNFISLWTVTVLSSATGSYHQFLMSNQSSGNTCTLWGFSVTSLFNSSREVPCIWHWHLYLATHVYWEGCHTLYRVTPIKFLYMNIYETYKIVRFSHLFFKHPLCYFSTSFCPTLPSLFPLKPDPFLVSWVLQEFV